MTLVAGTGGPSPERWRELDYHLQRFVDGNADEKVVAVNSIALIIGQNRDVPLAKIKGALTLLDQHTPPNAPIEVLAAVYGYFAIRAHVLPELQAKTLNVFQAAETAPLVLRSMLEGYRRCTPSWTEIGLYEPITSLVQHPDKTVGILALNAIDFRLSLNVGQREVPLAARLKADQAFVNQIKNFSSSGEHGFAHSADAILVALGLRSPPAENDFVEEDGPALEEIEPSLERGSGLSAEKLARFEAELREHSKTPLDFVRYLFKDGARVVLLGNQAGSEYLPPLAKLLLDLNQKGAVSHLMLPIWRSREQGFANYFQGQDPKFPVEQCLMDALGFRIFAPFDAQDQKLVRDFLFALRRKLELVAYGDTLEELKADIPRGELFVQYRLEPILLALKTPGARVLILDGYSNLGRSDSLAPIEASNTFLHRELAERLGPEAVRHILLTERDRWDNYTDYQEVGPTADQFPERSFAMKVPGTQLADIPVRTEYYPKEMIRPLGEVWDGIIVFFSPDEDDDQPPVEDPTPVVKDVVPRRPSLAPVGE